MITVKTTTEKQEPKPFPKLMISENGNIVLFSEPDFGTLIVPSSTIGKEIGYWHESWDTEVFTDYNEPITIQNA